MKTTCELEDFLGNAGPMAVRGKDGSLILAQPDGGKIRTISLNRQSAEKLARWILGESDRLADREGGGG